MTDAQLRPRDVINLATLMKSYLQNVGFVELLPSGYGFKMLREQHEAENEITRLAIDVLADHLGLSDSMDNLWTLAQLGVDADSELKRSIVLASPVEGKRIRGLVEARRDADLFDADGIPCHFDRHSDISWE